MREHEVDKVVRDAMNKLPPGKRKAAHLATVFHTGNITTFDVSYTTVMEVATQLRRGGISVSRAEAIENAYDSVLGSATDHKWCRTGEVYLNRAAGIATALCVEEDGVLLDA